MIAVQPKAAVEVGDDLYFMGFDSYVPLARERTLVRGRRLWRDYPLLGAYVLVRATKAWCGVFKSRGVRGVLMDGGGGEPRLVPDAQVSAIRALETKGRIGPRAAAKFERGDLVQVRAGPWASFPGRFEYDRGNALGVLINLFGAERVVEVPSEGVSLEGYR